MELLQAVFRYCLETTARNGYDPYCLNMTRLNNTENKAMTLTTMLLIIILVMIALLVWTMQRIQFQNKALLQRERGITQIKTAMIEREAGFQKQLDKEIKEAQKRSNNMQRNVLKGQIGEQFTPFITDFPYNPSDCRFMGEPIDYVIFQNLHECADGNVPIEDVHLIIAEVKTGNARLNQRQKIIKQAIQNGQVSFKELRIKYCEDTEDMRVQVSV